jgi:crossover junction endodeoxyribonuclease RuvC
MIVLGVDPGTAITGFGIIEEKEDQTLIVLDCGAIRTSSTLSDWDRLQILYQKIREIILLHQPDCGAVEKLFFQRNVSTAISVGQARGVILLAMAQNGLQVGEYTPLEVKQAVVGYGRAEKSQVQRMVTTLLALEITPSPDDVADALAVAICHLNSYKMKNLGKETD